MTFLERPPSTKWESLPSSAGLTHGLSVWWKPSEAPQSLLVRIPSQTSSGPAVTIRAVLSAIGIDPRIVATWYVCGTQQPGRQGMNPLLDAPLPAGAFGDNQAILVSLDPALLRAHAAHENALNAIDRIAADWNAALQMEHLLDLSRKQVYDALGRINALNRDLSSEERMYGDRQDQADWQEARRWLRDVAARLSKLLKECDIGMSSAAGRRNTFESIYHQVIAPRRPCEGLDSFQREFEAHRKTIQTLLLSMGSAQTVATQDGERRAQQVLQRIAAKVRTARTKRP
jgi:hypothetical protein